MHLIVVLKRVLRGNAPRTALASYFAFFSAAVCGLVSILIAVAYLNKTDLGLWAVISAVVTYLLWMDLGVGEATGRKMAGAVAAADQQEINRWWTTTRLVLAGQGLLVACMGLVLLVPFIRFFDVPEWQRNQATLLFCGAAATAGLSMPLRGVPGLMVAQQRAYWTGIWQGFSPWVNLISFYLFLRWGWGLTAYLVAMLATQGATWLYYAILVRTGPQVPRWDFAGLTKQRISSLFRFSVSLSLMGIIDSFVSTLPTLVLGRYGGLGLVPVFTFTSKCPVLLVSLVNRTIWAFYPGILRGYVGGGAAGIPAKHRMVTLIVTAMGLLLAGGVVAFNESLVVLLAGRDFYAGPLVNAMFAAAILVEPASHMFRFFLHLGGSAGYSALVALANLVLGTVLAVVGFHTFGLPGLTAVGLLLPLPLAVYGLIHGGRVCGFVAGSISKVGPVLTASGVGIILAAGWLLERGGPAGQYLTIHNSELMIPGLATVLAGAVLWAFGGLVGVWAWRGSPYGR
jgi:O-antigen/teichoic acid export membrane protein